VRNGVVVFLSANSTLHFLNATTGQEFLSLPPDPTVSFPSIDGQIIYQGPPDNAPSASIRAFHIPDGRLLWTYPLPKDTSVQAEKDGMIYLSAAANSTVIALRGSDRHLLWTYHSSDGQPVANTFFAENGIGYLFQQDATVVGIRVSDGQVLWRTQIAALKNQNLQTLTLKLDQGNLVLYPRGSALPMSVLHGSDGHLLWSSSATITDPIPLNGTLYEWQNNGQLDAWRESDGQHLWSYRAPIGSSIGGSLTEGSPLLFLFDPVGTFSVLRATDGKLLWRSP
jgi:outer membrane protein assembly factor BamB